MTALQHAFRLFVRRPLMTAVAVLALAAGAGASIAAFSVLDQVVLRKPALRDSDRLVVQQNLVSPADFHDLRTSGAFESSAAWMRWNFDLTGQGAAERLRGVLASSELFQTLGRDAVVGRVLTARDPGDAIVISHALWQRAFGGDRSIVGRRIILDGQPNTVVGVMPADFAYPDEQTDLWTPLIWGVHFQRDDREGRNLRMIARLKRGVSAEEAGAIASSIIERVSGEKHLGAALRTLHEEETRELRPALLVVFAAAAAMLLIACANVVNLMLMLGSSRRRELATRIALGAGPSRLLRQAFAEGSILGGAAAAGGIAIALVALRFAATMHLPLSSHALSLSPAACIAGAVAAWLAGVVAMTVPMVARGSLAVFAARNDTAAGGGAMRAAFVVIQVALTCALLVSGGALVKSFARLMSVPLGFDARNVLTARVWLPRRAYDTNEKQIAYFESLRERLAQLPGVTAAATIQDLPLRKNAMTFPVASANRETKGAYRVVGGNYFEAMRIPLLRGRGFQQTEPERVFIINRALAATLGADPIGQTMRIGDGPAGTIVGICGDVRQMGLEEDDVPAVYQPATQKQFEFLRWSTIVLRANGVDARRLMNEAAAIDPNVPLYDVITLEDLLGEHVSKPRVTLWLVAALAATAFAIALIGIGGVLSYSVSLRTREIAVRVALGARPLELLRLVVTQAWMLVVAGMAAGFTLAVLAAPSLDRLLFRVKAVDPAVYALVALAVFVATTAAALIPAGRAARIDPAATLRAE
jgi:predicted permease